jgi:hypothetical protein
VVRGASWRTLPRARNRSDPSPGHACVCACDARAPALRVLSVAVTGVSVREGAGCGAHRRQWVRDAVVGRCEHRELSDEVVSVKKTLITCDNCAGRTEKEFAIIGEYCSSCAKGDAIDLTQIA